jgi:hypothetical protein
VAIYSTTLAPNSKVTCGKRFVPLSGVLVWQSALGPDIQLISFTVDYDNDNDYAVDRQRQIDALSTILPGYSFWLACGECFRLAGFQAAQTVAPLLLLLPLALPLPRPTAFKIRLHPSHRLNPVFHHLQASKRGSNKPSKTFQGP